MTTTPNSTTIPKTSGIYKIICTANEKVYIGSAVDLRGRWRTHISRLRRVAHHNRHMQSAFNKYGESAFAFEVIELVLVSFLLEREQFWMDKLKAHNPKYGFNIRTDARSNLGLKASEETRAKQGAASKAAIRTPEWRANQSKALKGRIMRPESIEKMRKSKKGWKPSPEAVEKMRQSHIGQKRSAEFCAALGDRSRGKPKSEEQRRKISETLKKTSPWKGRKHTEASIQKVRENRFGIGAKTYLITLPDGSTETVTHLGTFCQKHDLNFKSFCNYIRDGKSYRGYIGVKVSDPF